MATLLIHAGHGKTGSSYLQNTLLLSHANLAKESIYYPKNISDSEADYGAITSGNARHCFESIDLLEKMLISTPIETHSVFLSSEFVFGHIPNLIENDRKNNFENIKELNRRFGLENWKILLFIRDPMSFAISAWLQRVKSHRETRPLEQFVLDWPSTYPLRVRGFIGICSELDFIEISIFNYSRIKNQIIQVVTEWLGIKPGILIAPKIRRINRSLTIDEAYVISRLNRSNLKLKGHLGKILVEKLPHIESGNFKLPIEVQRQFNELIEEEMNIVANYVSDGHEYRFEQLPDCEPVSTHRFTSEQIDIILDYMIDNVSREKLL